MNKKHVSFVVFLCFFSFVVGKWSGNIKTHSPDNNRSISSVESMSLEESKEIEKINKAIVSIRDKSEVIPLINKLEQAAKDNPDFHVVNLYAQAMKPIKSAQGIVWRMRPLIQECGSCHLTVLNAFKKLYYKTYLSGPHVKAIYDYFIEPNVAAAPFKKVSDLQEFAHGTLIPQLESSANAWEQILNQLPDSYVFDFDNYLITGYYEATKPGESDIRFMSNKKERRYKKVVKGHLQLVLAQKYRMLGLMKWSVNYNFNEISSYMAHVVRKTALNNLLRTLPKNATPLEHLKYLRDKDFKTIGKARTKRFSQDQIQTNLDGAFDSFIKSIRHRRDGIENAIAQADINDNDSYIIRPAALTINDENIIKNLTTRLELFEGARAGNVKPITSEATGLTFNVDPGAFFRYHDDLKAVFLPAYSTSSRDRGRMFASTDRGGCVTKTGGHKDLGPSFNSLKTPKLGDNKSRNCLREVGGFKKIHQWNFFYGMPLSWNDPTLGGLVPGTTNENFYEVLRSLKLTPATRRMGLVLPFL